jgi:uncharacterized membrane protein
MKKQLSLYVMAAFYLLAGLNHFRNPEAYYPIIPSYVGDAGLINILSGIAETALAILLLFKVTRRWACYGIILMLLAFIPAHIYMLQKGFCVEGNCAPGWLLWVRLLVLQPLLILWAWKNR